MDSDITMVAHLAIMDKAANYRSWIYGQIAPYIGQHILEVGAGIGNFTSMILDRELVVATDKYERCVNHLSRRHGVHLRVPPIVLDLNRPNGQLDDWQFDTVICLNVLEHIEDDLGALVYMRSKLRPKGNLILMVPAFQFLYGPIDRAVEHYRRYRIKDLLHRMRLAGFSIENVQYMNIAGILGWFLINQIMRQDGESKLQITFADRFFVPLARLVERCISPPLGLSIIAIGGNTDSAGQNTSPEYSSNGTHN